jgi:hypothetical protein
MNKTNLIENDKYAALQENNGRMFISSHLISSLGKATQSTNIRNLFFFYITGIFAGPNAFLPHTIYKQLLFLLYTCTSIKKMDCPHL